MPLEHTRIRPLLSGICNAAWNRYPLQLKKSEIAMIIIIAIRAFTLIIILKIDSTIVFLFGYC